MVDEVNIRKNVGCCVDSACTLIYQPHDHSLKIKSVFVKNQTGLIKLETEIGTVCMALITSQMYLGVNQRHYRTKIIFEMK